MPRNAPVLKMRSWMMGLVLGICALSLAPSLLTPWMLSLLLAGAMLAIWADVPAKGLCAGFLLGLVVGNVYGHTLLDHKLSSDCEGFYLTVEGVVISLPKKSITREGTARQRFEFRPDTVLPNRCSGPRRLLLTYYGDAVFEPASRWRLELRLKRPWGLANPGSFNMQSWYAQTGIDGTGNVTENRALPLKAQADWRLYHHGIRQLISARLENIAIDKSVRGILQALTVADKSGVNNTLWSLFQFYGINHLLVISGLHISLMAAAGYVLGGVIGRLFTTVGYARLGGAFPGLLALLFAFLYTSLAGFSLAAVRALIMLACFVIASFFARLSSGWNKLLIACVLVLIGNPLAATGSGFWLSFVAVGCLLWLAMWRANSRFPVQLLQTHVYMALLMVPLGGWLFGGVSVVAALANFFMIPLIGLFVVPLCLLGAVCFLLGIPLDEQLWSLAAWPLERLMPVAQLFAERHGGYLYHYLSPSLLEVALVMSALAAVLLPLPGRVKLLIPVLVLPIVLPQQTPVSSQKTATTITLLDVGQGTAIVVQSGVHTLVYDTGGGDPDGFNMASWVILPYLRSRDIQQLDTLVISHADNDHSAGVGTLLNAMPVRQVLVGERLEAYPKAIRCRAGRAWQWPTGVSFQILSPVNSPQGDQGNNSSCVLKIQTEGVAFLFPGDIAADRERELVLYWGDKLRSDWLLAAHHGSLTSSSYAWLKTVRAAGFLFSAGYLNQFGHPHRKVVQRNLKLGNQQLSTALDGALEITVEPGGEVKVTTYRSSHRRYWM